MLKEFMAFLKQYGVIGLAIAVIIGGKLNVPPKKAGSARPWTAS